MPLSVGTSDYPKLPAAPRYPVLKVVEKRSRISPAIRGRLPLRRFFLSENSEFWCIVSGILCDLVLQESKQETPYRPGKGTRAPTRATRPHFKPWRYHGTFRSIETSAIVKQKHGTAEDYCCVACTELSAVLFWRLSVAAGEVTRHRTERYFDVSGQVQRPVETSTGRVKLSQLQDTSTSSDFSRLLVVC